MQCCYMPPKDVLAVLDYQFDWRAWLQPEEEIVGDPVVTASGLNLNPDGQVTTVTSNVVTFWLSGGVIGGSYPVSCLISTNQGRTDERSFLLNVVDRTC
jgi:hypothetical protein